MRGRYRRLRRAWKPAAVFGALMFLSAAAGGPAAAQQRAVCPDLPGVSATSNADNYRVLCEEDAESEKDIAIDLDKFDIVTSGRQHHGVAGIHHGPGGVAIDLANGSITVNEVNSHGVYGRIHGESNAGISSASNGAKDLRIEVTGMDIDIDVASGSSRTEKVNSHGIYGGHDGVGNLRIEATGTDIDIDMDLVGAYGTKAYGIYGRHGEKRGNLTIDVAGGSITTNRQDSDGIHGSHEGDGELDIDVVGIEIETDNFNASGIYGEHLGTGNLTIDVEDGSVYTEGTNSHGIEGRHDGAGNLRIETTDVDIDTAGADALDTSAYGIFGRHSGSSGDLTVDVRGGSIDTTQEGGHAVIAIIQPTGGDKGGGDIRIDVRGGSFRTRGKGLRRLQHHSQGGVGQSRHGYPGRRHRHGECGVGLPLLWHLRFEPQLDGGQGRHRRPRAAPSTRRAAEPSASEAATAWLPARAISTSTCRAAPP